MIPVTLPVFVFGLIVCYCVERFKLFGYGAELPESVRHILQIHDKNSHQKREQREKLQLDLSSIGRYLVNYRFSFSFSRIRPNLFVRDHPNYFILRHH